MTDHDITAASSVRPTTIGIFAHVDTGKTTFSEQALFHAGVLRRAGRVDNMDTALDSDPMERQRGITIFSDQAHFYVGERHYYWIDTPGHVDFSPEAIRSLMALDYALLLVSASEGVQSHTRTLWRMLTAHNIPVIIFINKCDIVGADYNRTLRQIKNVLTEDAVLMPLPFNTVSDELAEQIAMHDESLLDSYLSGDVDEKRMFDVLRTLISRRQFVPCFKGSALHDEGVAELLQALNVITFVPDTGVELGFEGLIYKIRHEGMTRLTFIKVRSGRLNVRDEVKVCDPSAPNGVSAQKITAIRIYSGIKYESVQAVNAGDLCALVGIECCMPGDTIGSKPRIAPRDAMSPIVSASITAGSGHTDVQLMNALRTIEQEEPTLGVTWDDVHKQARVASMGKIGLEVLKEQLMSRFGIDAVFSPCTVLYNETVDKAVIGVGHYEPLRHYAEVVLRIEPADRGSGITFKSEAHVDELPLQYQNLIRTHVFERVHRGVLTGAPLTDVTITLVAGRFHLKHTEGGDFREATYRAIRQALMHADNRLLEPICAFDIVVPQDSAGKLTSELVRFNAVLAESIPEGEDMRLTGTMPVSDMLTLAEEFAMLTHGKGSLSYAPDHYDACHDAAEVIAQADYNPLGDIEQTPHSVFCSHGAGFVVNWDKAPDFCHCEAGKTAI